MTVTSTASKEPLTADLGTGSFTVGDHSRHDETLVSEIPLMNGSFDRRILGFVTVYTLSGKVLPQDVSFFEGLCACAGTVLERVTIGTASLSNLYVSKAELTLPGDSHTGSYKIVLREL